MSKNKDVIRDFLTTIWSTDDEEAAADAGRARDAVSVGLNRSKLPNQAAYLAFVRLAKRVLSDTKMDIHDLVEEGDLVSLRATLRATTRKGGKPVSVTGMGLARMKDGKIVESWNSWDALGLSAQLGVSGGASLVEVLTLALQ
jgi:ketosteroid isomerase-like protein